MPSFVKDNFVFISLILLIICLFLIGGVLIKSDRGDGKRKKIGGWLIFGGLWPLLDKNANRDLSTYEKTGILVVVVLMLGAFIYTFIETNGTFVW